MSKSYTDAEKEYIKNNLIIQAEHCIRQYGFKKTTIEELTLRCRIAKGSFYHFYSSKEYLFWDVIIKWHDEIEKELYQQVSSMKNISVDGITDIITGCYLKCFSLGLGDILTNGELADLIPKLPQSLFIENQRIDADLMTNLLKMLPGGENLDISLYSGTFSGIFLMLVYRHQLGERFSDILRHTIRGVVIQMLDELKIHNMGDGEYDPSK